MTYFFSQSDGLFYPWTYASTMRVWFCCDEQACVALHKPAGLWWID